MCISLGQFSTVRLERDTQLLIPVYDYCIPSNECTLAGGDCSCEDPCKVFDAVEFPMDDFFPPAAMPTVAAAARAPAVTSKKSSAKNGEFPRFFFCPKRDKPGISVSTAS